MDEAYWAKWIERETMDGTLTSLQAIGRSTDKVYVRVFSRESTKQALVEVSGVARPVQETKLTESDTNSLHGDYRKESGASA